MNNVKVTLATTLSVLALTFSGAASADNGKRFENHEHKNVITKTTYSKNKWVKNANRQKTRNTKFVKKVVIKHTPTKQRVVTKSNVRKPVKSLHATNKRFKHVKTFNKQYSQYQKQAAYKNSSTYKNRYKRVNVQRAAKQKSYSVRSGDTLIQISYKTGVSIQKIARLNRIKSRNLNYLQVGQILRLV